MRSLFLCPLALAISSFAFGANPVTTTPATPVTNVENPAHNSIAFESSVYVSVISKTPIAFVTGSHTIYTVPTGKQLVIESFSARCDSPILSYALYVYNDHTGNSAVRATAYAAPMNVAGGSVGYAQTRMYAGPGAVLQFNALITANDTNAQCVPAFSGYLLNAQ